MYPHSNLGLCKGDCLCKKGLKSDELGIYDENGEFWQGDIGPTVPGTLVVASQSLTYSRLAFRGIWLSLQGPTKHSPTAGYRVLGQLGR